MNTEKFNGLWSSPNYPLKWDFSVINFAMKTLRTEGNVSIYKRTEVQPLS